jgi:hypothetical protein
MSDSQERQFAVGSDTVDKCDCPAVAAGYDTAKSDVAAMAGGYDFFACHDTPHGYAEFTVSEKRAKEAWLEAIDDAPANEANVGRDIATELGWL